MGDQEEVRRGHDKDALKPLSTFKNTDMNSQYLDEKFLGLDRCRTAFDAGDKPSALVLTLDCNL